MSLSPAFVPWAVPTFVVALLVLALVWLVAPRPVRAVWTRLWMADAVALWLAYAAGYHLLFYLPHGRLALLGGPWALGALCVLLAAYAVVRLLPTPLRRPDVGFVLVVLTWALVLGAGFRHLEHTAADLARLREHPAALLEAPQPTALHRALLFPRLPPGLAQRTREVLADLDAGTLSPVRRTTFVLRIAPDLVAQYEHELARRRNAHWTQVGLLAVLLLLWGFGPHVRQA